MKRRTFLKNGLLLSSLGAIAPYVSLEKALAKSTDSLPQFFIQISLTGGWHTSLSLDPWIAADRPNEKEAFIEYRSDEVFKEGNIYLGPAMKSMQSFAPQMNIINGIFISTSDGGHNSAEIYMHSGDGSGKYGAFCVEHELVNQTYPLGVLFNNSVYKGASSVDSNSVSLLSSLQVSATVGSKFDNPNSPIYKAQQNISNNAAQINQFNKSIYELKQAGKTLTDGHYIALSYKHGLAANASYFITNQNLDTHASHEGAHLIAQSKMWDSVAEMLKSFKEIEATQGFSMFDLTTFYVTSEFSRTPALNASKGTDHNPFNNSALIIGPKFKGNTVFGASQIITSDQSVNGASYLSAQMVDLKTGAIIKTKADAKAKGSLIRPETVIATLAQSLGIQRNIFPVIAMEEKSIGLILK